MSDHLDHLHDVIDDALARRDLPAFRAALCGYTAATDQHDAWVAHATAWARHGLDHLEAWLREQPPPGPSS